jgi:hypothetical protein
MRKFEDDYFEILPLIPTVLAPAATAFNAYSI